MIVVDDFSTDNTVQIVQAFNNVKLIQLKDFVSSPINSYKKKAIEIAIGQSNGELIVTTDADCIVLPEWLLTIAAFYEQTNAAFIAAPVAYLPPLKNEDLFKQFLKIFQLLDFTTLQGITGASVEKKFHSMCNGANLAYPKKIFYEVNGFAGIDNIASGDDMLLMNKISNLYKDKVFYLKSPKAIVHTQAMDNVKDFFYQRIRWAGKYDSYTDKKIKIVLAFVYLFNVLLFILPIIGLFKVINHSLFTIPHSPYTIHFSLLQLWLFFLLIKTIAELFFLLPITKFFGQTKWLWIFPLLQPFHIVYTVIAGWLGMFGSYQWKERKVK